MQNFYLQWSHELFSPSFTQMDNFSYSLHFTETQYSEFEGTHHDHQVQLLNEWPTP